MDIPLQEDKRGGNGALSADYEYDETDMDYWAPATEEDKLLIQLSKLGILFIQQQDLQ